MQPSVSPAKRPWWQQLTMRDVALGTIVVLAVVLGVIMLLAVRNILVGVFLGVLLATGLRPTMTWFQRYGVPRTGAASLALAFIIAFLLGAVALIVPLAFAQIAAFFTTLPALIEDLQRQLLSSRLTLVRQLGTQLFQMNQAWSSGESNPSALFAPLTLAAPIIGSTLFFTVTTLLFAYYWLLYRDRSVTELLLLLPTERRESISGLWEQIERQLGAFVRGQLILSAVTGVFSLIGYWLIGLPYALVLALIAALLEFVPYLGAIITTALAVAIGLSVSPELGVLALLVGLLVQQLENNILVPRIMAHAVGISPVVTLLAFVGFTSLFGPAGGFIAVPLAAALQLLFRAWANREDQTIAAGEERDELARLRYEMADLSQDLARRLRERPDADEAPNDDPEEKIEAVLVELQTFLKQPDNQEVRS